MALISIPTSIGGINIPGGLFDGPLSDLTQTGGQFSYQYPRDLGSSTKSHSVVFTIQEIQEVTLKEAEGFLSTAVDKGADLLGGDALSKSFAALKDGSNGKLGAAVDFITNFEPSKVTGADTLNSAKSVAKQIISGGSSGLKTLGSMVDSLGNLLNTQRKQTAGRINLYMPENFSLSTAINYDDNTTMASVMGSLPLIGNVVKSATNVFEGNDALKLALNRAGFVYNPQKQLLFQGIDFRTFSMSFTFTPYSQAEAQQVKNIIEKFRMYAAPKKNSEFSANMFFVPPAIFNIDFIFHNAHNVHLPKLKDCVIESLEVNYAPNGWTAHTDGAPVQTTMTIEFKEIALIDRTDISQGY
jgi:hypothetical protein